MSKLVAGSRVRAKQDIWQDADDDFPGGLLAARGDELIIRRVGKPQDCWEFYVHHEGRSGAFGVDEPEIEDA